MPSDAGSAAAYGRPHLPRHRQPSDVFTSFRALGTGLTPEIANYNSGIPKRHRGMRAIAVVCVIINHLNHAALPGGYLGVDVFFVISGYVITSSLEKTTYSSLGAQLLHFYSRRIKRLMPALLTMAFVTSAVIRLFDPDALVSTLTGVTSIFGLSNFFLFSEATTTSAPARNATPSAIPGPLASRNNSISSTRFCFDGEGLVPRVPSGTIVSASPRWRRFPPSRSCSSSGLMKTISLPPTS